jgi:uncharacterized protein (DUF779 family)
MGRGIKAGCVWTNCHHLNLAHAAFGGCPFYMSRAQFEYGRHTYLTIDVVRGRGGLFSLEKGTGKRLLTRSRLRRKSGRT